MIDVVSAAERKLANLLSAKPISAADVADREPSRRAELVAALSSAEGALRTARASAAAPAETSLAALISGGGAGGGGGGGGGASVSSPFGGGGGGSSWPSVRASVPGVEGPTWTIRATRLFPCDGRRFWRLVEAPDLTDAAAVTFAAVTSVSSDSSFSC